MQSEVRCNDLLTPCFESSLYLTPPKMDADSELSEFDCDSVNYEKLISSDLLYEINKCTTAFKDITNSASSSTSTDEEPKPSKKNKKGYAFPDGGWVCSKCQNYNFYGRVKCNRCKKEKDKEDSDGKPKHLLRFDDPGQSDKATQPKVAVAERAGDWVCAYCQNLNFAFRKHCNRCSKTKEEAIKAAQP